MYYSAQEAKFRSKCQMFGVTGAYQPPTIDFFGSRQWVVEVLKSGLKNVTNIQLFQHIFNVLHHNTVLIALNPGQN